MDHLTFAQLLGNYGEFFGAIAVVVTLGYLAIQIRQSNLASQSAAIQSFFDSFSSVNERSHDEAFVHLLRRGFNEWESLSSVEQAQMHLYWNDYISKLHMGFRLYQRRVLDEGSYIGWEHFLVAALQTPAAMGVWEAGKTVYPPDFIEKIEGRLSDSDTRPPSVTDAFAYWKSDGE
jgi:hypothetical protein